MDRWELLQRATAAVVRVAPDGAEEVLGTAWLATSSGFLVTAAHVVSGQEGVVGVRFPGRATVPTHVKAGPVLDRPRGVDLAILEVAEPDVADREPLPMVLLNNPHGDVVVCGYGTNLPNAQSIGVGEFLRPYIRGNTPSNYLLQYKSHELAVPGYSGGAVYSLTAGAVVGLQIEASGPSDQVLAMPLSRIPEFWEELTSVARYGRRGLCVVLAPRGTDDALLTTVVEPVLQDLHLEMYVSTRGVTSPRDLERLDDADLVVADATVDDSFVTRELTIAQGLGTPDVVVRRGPEHAGADALHSSVLFLPADPTAARRSLRTRLLRALDTYDAVGELVSANPVTSYFGAPLTQVSAANALALGYFTNFVAPVGHALCRAAEAANATDVVVKVDDRAIDLSRYRGDLRLVTVVPGRLRWALDSGSKVRRELQRQAVDVASVNANGLSRERRLNVLKGWEKSDHLTLLDIFPTTMASLVDSINERFRDRRDIDDERWRAIERKEIDRFSRGVARRIREDVYDASSIDLDAVCQIMTFSEAFPDLPEPML